MPELQEQLALVRRRIATIDRKYAHPAPQPATAPADEAAWDSAAVDTPCGRHIEREQLYGRLGRHGSYEISRMEELPEDLLGPISAGAIPPSPAARWAFLDTETTGLSGGTGTCAFLAGVGRLTADGFRVRQFFMRDFADEPSLLWALDRHLADFDVVVTYNGIAFDQPLLETRYRLARQRPPFGRLAHLDLLFGARRLWKLRLDNCRLVELENRILGVERYGDVPGAMIPQLYFDYVRTRRARLLDAVFQHNATDIISLACLTGIVSQVFHSPREARLAHGAEMVGLARWLRQAGQWESALLLFRQAVDRGLPDHLLFRTLWDISVVERRLGRPAAALAILTDLAASPNEHQVEALEALAKHYEHKERNAAIALEFTHAALLLQDSTELRHRRDRLGRLLQGSRGRRLL